MEIICSLAHSQGGFNFASSSLFSKGHTDANAHEKVQIIAQNYPDCLSLFPPIQILTSIGMKQKVMKVSSKELIFGQNTYALNDPEILHNDSRNYSDETDMAV